MYSGYYYSMWNVCQIVQQSNHQFFKLCNNALIKPPITSICTPYFSKKNMENPFWYEFREWWIWREKGWIWFQWTQFSLVTLRLVFVVLETLIEYTLGMYNAPKIRKKTRCHVTRLDSVNLLMCSCSTSLHFFSYWKEDGKPTIATPNGFSALTLDRICSFQSFKRLPSWDTHICII